jgi:hypothetical protein
MGATETTRDLEELRLQVSKAIKDCETKETSLEGRRKARHPIIRKTESLQLFCTRMSEFLEAFPQIADASRAADPHIGGGAVAGLSILFQVGDSIALTTL